MSHNFRGSFVASSSLFQKIRLYASVLQIESWDHEKLVGNTKNNLRTEINIDIEKPQITNLEAYFSFTFLYGTVHWHKEQIWSTSVVTIFDPLSRVLGVIYRFVKFLVVGRFTICDDLGTVMTYYFSDCSIYGNEKLSLSSLLYLRGVYIWRLINKRGKFLKKLWCCVSERV